MADGSRRAYAGSMTARDDQISRVLEALDRKHRRDNTLLVFQSDNGGSQSATFTGEIDESNSVVPCDNGPYYDDKESVYEGGTRIIALANWPGHIKGVQP
jgi:arylsulfatase A-like enzyme